MALLHAGLGSRIIQAFYDAHFELGVGFPEAIYSNAMALALRTEGLNVEREVTLPVWFRGQVIGSFRADILVESRILLELKAGNRPAEVAEAQLMTYLRGTNVEVGYVLAFGLKARFKRYLYTNDRKHFRVPSQVPCDP